VEYNTYTRETTLGDKDEYKNIRGTRMVFQSEIIEFSTEKFIKGSTFTINSGESSSVDYSDNTLDTVHSTISNVTATISNNVVKHEGILDAASGNGVTHNSIMLRGDDKALNKNLFTPLTKDIKR